jgi:hypothetical protein
MDMMSYVDGKAAGSVTLAKVGFETYQMVAKRFDNATGQETYPELVTLNRKNVQEAQDAAAKALDEAQKRVVGVAALVKDLDALDAK